MFDFGTTSSQMSHRPDAALRASPSVSATFLVCKRLFDICFSLLLLPILVALVVILLLANPAMNTGPLFFVQRRMGKNCAPFQALKFRTMRPGAVHRSADDPLEEERITPLGAFLRQCRLDELPQILNVLRGEMSLIGPRPDCFDHAVVFVQDVPGYRDRHKVLPGISGYAQTEVGYAEGIEATMRKVQADLFYISNRSIFFEAWIFWRTVITVVGRAGQ